MVNQASFETVAQRALFAYRVAYSDFSPVASERASVEGQRALHSAMGALQGGLFRDPSLLGLPSDADKAYPWYLCNNQLPELDKVYRATFKALYDFYRFLYVAARDGEPHCGAVRISKELLKARKAAYKPAYKGALAVAGIDASADKEAVALAGDADMLAALRLLGASCERELDIYESYPPNNVYHDLFCFAACSFDGDMSYLLDRVDELRGLNGLLHALRKECEARGYSYDTRALLTATELSFNIVIRRGVGGFNIVYNPRKEDKVGFGTLNGVGEKAMLDDFDNLDADMREYFLSICRPCNGCLGCTKNGRNKPFTVKASRGGKECGLCPMFPRHSWETMDQALIDRLMKYHELQETYAK